MAHAESKKGKRRFCLMTSEICCHWSTVGSTPVGLLRNFSTALKVHALAPHLLHGIRGLARLQFAQECRVQANLHVCRCRRSGWGGSLRAGVQQHHVTLPRFLRPHQPDRCPAVRPLQPITGCLAACCPHSVHSLLYLGLPGPALPRRCPCLYCFTQCPQIPICRNGSGFSSDADGQASRSTLGNMPALAPDHLASLPGIGPVMVAAAADSFGSHSLTCQEHINF